MLRTLLITCAALSFACSNGDDQRCNPLQYSSNGIQGDCDTGLACVYPTTYPGKDPCGVAYCCALDSTGKITDTSPHCQPDPSLASVCMLDLGADGGGD